MLGALRSLFEVTALALPLGGGAQVPQAVYDSWIPPPPQPPVVQNLVPPISGPTATNPPFPGASVPQAALDDWIPPDPAPQVARNLNAALIPAPVAATTPIGAFIPQAVFDAWVPSDPAFQVAHNLIAKLLVSDPPVNGGARIPGAVLIWWIAPPPMPPVAINLDPPISVPQNPPFAGGAQIPESVLIGWIPPPPQPPSAINLDPPISVPQNPPFVGGAAIPKAVLVDWLPPDPRFQSAINLAPPLTVSTPPYAGGAQIPEGLLSWWVPADPVLIPAVKYVQQPVAPPSFVSVGTSIPQAVLNSYDWAPAWPWARAPVVTPSGPTPQNPPFPGTKLSTEVEVSWLPAAPMPIIGQQLFQGTTIVATFVARQQPGLVELEIAWSQPVPAIELPGLQAALVQASFVPPPYRATVEIQNAWAAFLQAPAAQVAINLDPPIAGPTPQNPPFMGGARIPLPVQVTWIPPPPQPPVAWTATQAFQPAPAPSLLQLDPEYVTVPRARVMVSKPLARLTLSWPPFRRFVTVPTVSPFVSYPKPRKFVTTPQVSGMPQGNPFPDIDPSETINGTWDFAPFLSTGVSISSIVATSCQLISGVDAAPGTRLIGASSIVASPTSGLASQAVRQQWGTMQAGALYSLTATVTTSDSQTLTVYAHQRCPAPS